LRWCYASGEPIPTGDELAAQKDAQLSQKDAQLLEEQARTKQAFIQAIELGLRLKFPDEGLLLLEEIAGISDVGVLQAIASYMTAANNLDEIRQIYQP
jgi:hypothetical protein